MAESDPDSNSLRQDQPECPEHDGSGVRREHKGVFTYRVRVRDTTDRTGCHRTTRANVRSRLDGGPQGRNPHLLRTSSYIVRRDKPSEADVIWGESTSPSEARCKDRRCRPRFRLLRIPSYIARGDKPSEAMSSKASRTRLRESIPRAELNGPRLRLLSAFHPSALYHLRASDSCFVGRFQPTFAFHSKSRLTHKPVGLDAVCGPLACFAKSPLTDDPSSKTARNVADTKTDYPRNGASTVCFEAFGGCRAAGGRPVIPRVRVGSGRVSGRAAVAPRAAAK